MKLSNLKLEDLVVVCARCNGTGQIDGLPAELPPSMGLRVAHMGSCPDCDHGKIYTPAGKVLRDFIHMIG